MSGIGPQEAVDPTVDDSKATQIEKLTQGLVFCMYTACEQPYPLAVEAAKQVAERMYDCGVRQTAEVAAVIDLPGWLTERVRESTAEVPVEPDHFEEMETERVAEAPAPPDKIAKKYIAVVQ